MYSPQLEMYASFSECQKMLDTALYLDTLTLRQETLQAKLGCVIQS